jgi:hypothetical protein
MNRTALMNQLLAEAVSQGFDQPAAAVGDEDDPAAQDEAAPFQILEQFFAKLVIF